MAQKKKVITKRKYQKRSEIKIPSEGKIICGVDVSGYDTGQPEEEIPDISIADMAVVAATSNGISRARFEINLTNFFKKNPKLSFKKMSVLIPKDIEGSTKNIEPLIVFDEESLSGSSAKIGELGRGQRKSFSPSHTQRLLTIAGENLPRGKGEKTNIFFSLNPVGQGGPDKVFRVCSLSVIDVRKSKRQSKGKHK